MILHLESSSMLNACQEAEDSCWSLCWVKQWAVVFGVVIAAHVFSMAHADAVVLDEHGREEETHSADGTASVSPLIWLAELCGVNSLYRYHQGVDPFTGTDLRDSDRVREGFRGVVSLLVTVLIVPVSMAIRRSMKKAANSKKP